MRLHRTNVLNLPPFQVSISPSLVVIIASCLIIVLPSSDAKFGAPSLSVGGSKTAANASAEQKGNSTNGSLSPVSNKKCSSTSRKLILVQVIFRHGDRTPLFPFPSDASCDDPFNSSLRTTAFKRKGLLTKRGRVQAFELGSFLGARYEDYLTGIWIPEDVHVQSSAVERSVMTAQTCLAGLFPPDCFDDNDPGCEGRWSREVQWQPIPVYTFPKESDRKINFQSKSCPAFESELREVLQCKEVRAFVKKNQHVFDIVKKNTGLPKVSMKNIGRVYDTLLIKALYGIPPPEWASEIFPEPMKTMEELGFQLLSANRKLMRLNGGPLLKDVMDNMKEAKERVTPTCPAIIQPKCLKRRKKLFLYSGHDTTVSAFLATLNVFDIHQPPYASAIMVELYHEEVDPAEDYDCDEKGSSTLSRQRFIVKVFYRNKTEDYDPPEMIIPGCGDPCYLDKLDKMVRDLMLSKSDWEQACRHEGWVAWMFKPARTAWSLLTALWNRFIVRPKTQGPCKCDGK